MSPASGVRRPPVGAERDWLCREGGAGDQPVVQGRTPELIKTLAGGAGQTGRGMLVLPVLADNLIVRTVRLFGEDRQYLVGRFAVVEGRDQRLYDRDGAVVGTSITP